MITEVVNGIFRGPHPIDPASLQKLGITIAIDLQTAYDDISYVEDESLSKAGIHVEHRPLSDFRFEDWSRLDMIVEMIAVYRAQGDFIYIHCTHGDDRTGLICCLFRIYKQGWPVEKAIREWINMGMHKFPYLFPLNWPGKVRKKFKEKK